MKFITTILTIFTIALSSGYAQQNTAGNSDIDISYHKNIELIGLAYFLGFEGVGMDSKTIEIEGKKVPKKDWHNYGYKVYKKYQKHAGSKHLERAFSLADHLWLDKIIYLLLQVDPVPNAKISSDIPLEAYLPFSKSKNPSEALKNANQFLDGLNKFSIEIDFDAFLNQSKPYYNKAIDEVKAGLKGRNYIDELENYFDEAFSSYHLIPSLTLPKGMGFGIKIERNVYSVVAGNDWQIIDDINNLQMGFTNKQKLKELSVHEFAHSFVNPKVAKLPDSLFVATQTLFEPIRTKIIAQGYNTWNVCMNEHFTRATELILAEKNDSPENYMTLKNEYISDREFIYIPTIINALKAAKAAEESFEQGLLKAMQQLKHFEIKETNCEVN